MSGKHEVNEAKDEINLPRTEANFAALCVAIVAGSVAGNMSTFLLDIIPIWSLLIIVAILGFVISWYVCRYFFKTAHIWYGNSSFNHRIYDGAGIVSAIVAFYI